MEVFFYLKDFTKICAANSYSFAEKSKWILFLKDDIFKI